MISDSVRLRTPFNVLDISIVYRAMDRKAERDQHCIECGMPMITISDKAVRVYDGRIATEHLRTNQRQLGITCKRRGCSQHYQLEV